MGRVKRYKKIKACDPFAKKKAVNPSSVLYDESPEDFEERRQKREKKLEQRLFKQNNPDDGNEDIHFNDAVLQQQAIRELQIQNSSYLSSRLSSSYATSDVNKKNKSNTAKKKSDPKITIKIRPGETMKSFTRRVNAEKRKILMEELPKQSLTAQRRKEKLKLIKLKKKMKKAGIPFNSNEDDDDQEEKLEFGSRSDGFIRPSDRNDSRVDFEKKEFIPFGEQAHAPPNLKSFASQLTKKQQKKMNERNLNSIIVSFDDKEQVTNQGINEENDVEDEQEEEENKQSKKKKRKKQPIDWDKFNSADDSKSNGNSFQFGGGDSSFPNLQNFPSDPLAYLNEKKKKSQQSMSLHAQQELEKSRKQIQLQYRLLNENKRKLSSAVSVI